MAMDAVQSSPPDSPFRERDLAEWRARNLLLTAFVGPVIGGEVAMILWMVGTTARVPLHLSAEFVGDAFALIAAAASLGMVLGFVPAVVAAVLTNRLRGVRLGSSARLLLAPIVGAVSVAMTYGPLLALLGRGLPASSLVLFLAAGTMAASICATIMELRGTRVADQSTS